MIAPRDRWLDREAGPIVRPYAVTKGRTTPDAGAAVGLIDVVVAVGGPPASMRLTPEHRQILGVCRRPVTVVDLASGIDLPVGVVRVLLGDLVRHGMLQTVRTPHGPVTDHRLLRDVLNGLQAL